VQWGTDGLFHAVDRFDPTLNIKFETYAIHRIRGAILDNIRKVDWVPRLVRQRYSKIQKATQALQTDLGRIPTDEELAQYMSMTVEDF
jgi:RNA polymerase sigma factor for flagellar operon FliA